MSVNPFEFVNAINGNKENLFETKGYGENDYVKFLVNRQFSMFPDTIMIANEANIALNNIPNKSHFEFYLNMVVPKRRYSKWYKADSNNKVTILCEVYNISEGKAREIVDLFSDSDIKEIEQRLYRGGIGKPARGTT
jgi:hypothetical protein